VDAFFSPVKLDLRVIKGVLSLFEKASGLTVNYSKSHVYPINYSEEHISLVLSIVSCSIADFPCTYLGVPYNLCSIRLLNVSNLGKLLNQSGRLVLA
jgi:hypothetical protein